MDKFAEAPSLQQLSRCRREDLLLVAGRFDVRAPAGVKKDDLRWLVTEALSERGLLASVPLVGGTGGAAMEPLAPLPVPPVAAPSVAPPAAVVGTSAEELQLLLRIKEVELSSWRWKRCI